MSQTHEFVLPGPDGTEENRLVLPAELPAHRDQRSRRIKRGTPALEALDVVGGAEAILAASARRDHLVGELARRATRSRSRFSALSRRYVRWTVLLDVLVGALTVLVPVMFSDSLSASPWLALGVTALGAVGWPLAILLANGYRPNTIGVGTDELRPAMRAGTAAIVLGAFPAGLGDQTALLTLLVIAIPLAVLSSTLIRFALRKHLHRQQRQGRCVRRVVVVGAADSVQSLAGRLAQETHAGMVVMGACVPWRERHQLDGSGIAVLGDLTEASDVIVASGCDAVAVTSDVQTRHSYLRQLSWSLEGTGVQMLVDPGLLDVAGPRMHVRPLMGFPLLHIDEPEFTGWRRVLKRASDLVLTSVGVVIISPLLVIIAAAVKLTDGGPVFFRQVRVGRDGRPFTMLKFRSMVVDAEARKADLMGQNEGHGALFKLARDPRVTRIGQVLRDFSLDELPQLLNVLQGSMSLVGPRPHLAAEVAAMPQEASRRALVTPGLTGLWQVSGRSDLDAAQSIRLDLRYVENWSLTMDLLILWKTAFAVLARSGAR